MTPIDPAATLDALASLVRDGFAVALLVFIRIGAAVAVLPGFGERVLPARLRLAGALAMTAVVVPAAAPQTAGVQLDAPFTFARVVGTEAFVGLALGLAIRLLVMALQVAGTIAAQATSLSQFFGGAGAEPQPAISQILMLGGIALLMLAGFPERAAEYLILSYDLLPAGDWPDPAAVADWGSERVARAFALGFSLSTPFLIGSVLYNLALGAINRAMPTLMVAFVGAPAMTVTALALLALASPQLLHQWLILADAALANPAAP